MPALLRVTLNVYFLCNHGNQMDKQFFNCTLRYLEQFLNQNVFLFTNYVFITFSELNILLAMTTFPKSLISV